MAGLELIEADFEEELGVGWGEFERGLEGGDGVGFVAEIFQKGALELERGLEVWVMGEQVLGEG